jgi:hypothetical protein
MRSREKERASEGREGGREGGHTRNEVMGKSVFVFDNGTRMDSKSIRIMLTAIGPIEYSTAN